MKIEMIFIGEDCKELFPQINRLYFDYFYDDEKLTIFSHDFNASENDEIEVWTELNRKFCQRLKQEIPT